MIIYCYFFSDKYGKKRRGKLHKYRTETRRKYAKCETIFFSDIITEKKVLTISKY